MYKYTSEGKSVMAKNYKEAAEKLFGQTWYENPATHDGNIPTTYVDRHAGYATVRVYKVGDKQGSFWGVQAACPEIHEIRRECNHE